MHSIKSRPVARSCSKYNQDKVNDEQMNPYMVNEFVSLAQDLANAAGDAIMPFWRQKDVKCRQKIDAKISVHFNTNFYTKN